MTTAPNVLLVLADELRADALGCFGNPICLTPNLDRLASEGTLFEQCMITQPTCTPSRASLLTGCYPSALRSRMVGCYTPDDPRFLPRVLAGQGYRTASIGKLHLIPQAAEIERFQRGRAGVSESPTERNGERSEPMSTYFGFAEVDIVNGHGMHARGPNYSRWLADKVPDLDARTETARPLSPGVNNATGSLQTHTWTLPAEAHSGEYITERACDFLTDTAGHDDQPFFLHVSFPDPHHPTTIPDPYARMYDPADMPPPIPPVDPANGATDLQLTAHRGQQQPSTRDPVIGTPPDDYSRYTDADWQATKALYYGMVTLLDTQIGRILTTLDETGLSDNTIVVFATDHGEYLGDHGLMGKGFHYDSVLRTPMIVRGHGVQAGQRLDGVASTVDVAPTLLEYVGVDEPEGIQGTSMLDALAGHSALPRSAVLTENDDDFVPMRVRTVTTQDWKLTWYLNRADGELYDRRNDPSEQHNLWHDPAFSAVQNHLLAELLEQVVCAVDGANGRKQPPAPAVPKWLPRRLDSSTIESFNLSPQQEIR